MIKATMALGSGTDSVSTNGISVLSRTLDSLENNICRQCSQQEICGDYAPQCGDVRTIQQIRQTLAV